MTEISIHNLRCEYTTNPLGIDVQNPRLSWQIVAERRNVTQAADQTRCETRAASCGIRARLMWEMGLLEPGDWQARWIEPEKEVDPEAFKPCPYLHRTFEVHGQVEKARLYATAHGCYNVYLNGRHVGDRVFAPGYTSYLKRLQYQVYDVTEYPQEGGNTICALLGDGWWRGRGSFIPRYETTMVTSWPCWLSCT